MLPRIVLFVLQLVIAWACADWIVLPVVRTLGLSREYTVLVYAAVYALIKTLSEKVQREQLRVRAEPCGINA